MSKSNIFLITTLLFLGGVLVGSSFSTVLLIGISIAIIEIIFLFRRKTWWAGIVFVIAFSIGILMIRNAETNRAALDPLDNADFAATFRGYIESDPYNINARQYFNFKTKEIIIDGDVLLKISDTIRITTEIHPDYEYGDTLEITGKLDGRRLYKPEISEIDYEAPFFSFLYRKIFDIKGAFLKSINGSILEPNASFINGILLGERSAIPQGLKNAFQRTGMVHILAISGYNVTIVVSLIYALLLLFLRRSRAFWFAVLGIFVFTILTGASASVVRAAIMGCLVLLAHKEGRMYSSSRALAATAAIMVVLDPLVIQEDIGFLLSFAATLGMLYLVPILSRYVRKIPEFYGAKEAAITTTSAQIMVLPLLLFFFGSVSPLSIIVNILVLPLIPFAMLTGFIAGLVGLVNIQLGAIVGYIPWLVTTIQIGIIEFFGRFKLWDFSFNLALLIFAYAVLIYILIRNKELT